MGFKKFSIVFLFVFHSALFSAQMVNGISVLVNDEPITLFEVHKVSKQMNISLREALNMLVQDRLEIAHAKKIGIEASDYEINNELKRVARENGVSVDELQQVVASKGISEEEYRDELAKEVQRRKLYKRIATTKNAMASEVEVRKYYDENQQKFELSEEYDVTAYKGENKAILQELIASPMKVVREISSARATLRSSEMDRRSIYMLEQSKEGSFTPIFKTPNGYAVYYLHKKIGKRRINFDMAKVSIEQTLEYNVRRRAIKNFFEKLKASASIVVVRNP